MSATMKGTQIGFLQYVRVITTFIFFSSYQFQIGDTRYNLYNTDRNLMMNQFGYDCLYYYPSELHHSPNGIIPFCIRPEIIKQFNDEKKFCHGKTITFGELKANNVNISDLFMWNAVIQMIDLYEKYLQFPILVNENKTYCNCSSLTRFGEFCQYGTNTDDYHDGFTSLLYDTQINHFPREIEKNDYLTCYIGIQCQTNLICLDWRQICNGIVDCDYGEDEPADLCLQLETNQCDPENEFRCQNGLCVPLSLVFTGINPCLDRSDDQRTFPTNPLYYLTTSCLRYPYLDCDETNYGWKRFSCNNGQSISYEDLTPKVSIKHRTCGNDYHIIYLRKLFSTTNETQCWKTMICLTGFDYLYSHLNCSDEINIEKSCPDEFYFPPNSVVYSFVYFLYYKTNRIDWFDYPGPNYICYKKEFCQNYRFNLPTFSNNDLTCFPVNQTLFSWVNFYEYIVHLFGPCFSSSIPINHPMLYQCHSSHSFISIYRVKNKRKDCFFNEDEDENIDICSLNTNDIFKCLSNSSQCVRQSSLADHEYDCRDGSDEYTRSMAYKLAEESGDLRPFIKRTLPEIYRFEDLCDHIIDRHLFSLESNETDETDCEHWPYTCNSPYTKCSKIWNCPDGRDEIECEYSYSDYIRQALNCKSNEHYCIQLIKNNSDVNATCIHMNRTGDGIIDCIGGTDERLTSICLEKYPNEFKRRFHCMNSTLCIQPDQVCNRINDCPFYDDELICPWLFQNNSSQFYCEISPARSIVRCDTPYRNDQHCQMREDLWFCDLEFDNERISNSFPIEFQPYPSIERNFDPHQQLLPEKQINSDFSLCNPGFPIKSLISNNKTFCLCPSPYYGDYCQYQSERLTVYLTIRPRYSMNPLTTFHLMIYLFNENNLISSYDEISINYQGTYADDVYLTYLLSERVSNLSLHQRSKFKYVRIDSYIINQTNIQYIASWFFSVSFPFLPVNRLAVNLLLVNESFKAMYCKKRCGSHGKCMHYINMKEKEYCWCNQGWFGEYCQLKSSSCNTTSCSPHSQCIVLNEEKKQMKCLCSLGKSGDQCYITHNPCFSNPCTNNGKCVPLDQRNSADRYICVDDNEWPVDSLFIFINGNITDLSLIPVIIVFFGFGNENIFIQDNRAIFTDVTLPTYLQVPSIDHNFGFIRIFYNISKNDYYLVSMRNELSPEPVNTSVISQNLCRNVSEIFNQTILNEYSYLKRLKLYHLPCNHDHNLRCFYDQYRMCMCTQTHNSSCYLFYNEYDNCNYCKNDGLCVKESLQMFQWKFRCLCPKCSSGSLCEFTSGNYFISLDLLVGIEMKKGETSFNQQPRIVHLTLAFLLLLLIINLIFNTISICVFWNKKLRQVGCDLYLLYLTIISEIGLVILFLRFLYMIIIQMYIIDNLLFIQISCISLEYLTRLIPSLFDWLTVCISIERAYTVIKDVQFTRIVALKTLKLSRWMILIVILLNILSTLHRPFYLILVDELNINDEPRGHPRCVLDFNSTTWIIYEKVINIFHLTIPFILNLISSIAFILHKTNFEFKSATRKKRDTRYFIVQEQLSKYKLLIVGPLAILIFEIPRFVFTFTLACIEYPWQRYVQLTGYLISFIPLTGILFIYILPSPKFKKQLQTFVKKTFRLSLFRTT